MTVGTLYLIAGIALLVYGGELLVRGASGIALLLRVSHLTTGLTVVAFGTSAPELTVNVLAAWRGSGALAFGNIMGSNMANIGLVVGCSALVRSIPIRRQVLRSEIPIMLVMVGATVAFGLDRWLGSGPDQYSRGEGLAMLFLFGLFLYYTFAGAQQERANNHDAASGPPHLRSLFRAGSVVLAGLVLLWTGAHLTVEGAMAVALGFQVPQEIIGISLVAVGTSLPELAASLTAIRRDQPDLVVGNVLGSNIFNLVLVLGASAVVRPIPVPPYGLADLAMLSLLSFSMLGLALLRKPRIGRLKGTLLIGLYGSYLIWRMSS